MSNYIPVELRQQVKASDGDRCCYCLTQALVSGIDLSFDHILPRSKGRETTFDNICLTCRACNEFKSNLTEFADPLTETVVPLFNPRGQSWVEHFAWSEDGTRVEGLTVIGRVTVAALQMKSGNASGGSKTMGSKRVAPTQRLKLVTQRLKLVTQTVTAVA